MKFKDKRIFSLGIAFSMSLGFILSVQASPEDTAQTRKTLRSSRTAKPRPTSEDISKKLASGEKFDSQKSDKADPERTDKQIEQPSLNSVYLVDNGVSTKIPSRSLIYIPDKLKGKVSDTLKGKLVPWDRFYGRNMNVIHMFAVNIHQARGTAKINQEQIEQFQRLGKIVIATHDGGLITVNPETLKPDKENKK